MQTTKPKFSYTVKEESPEGLPVIVAAAGSSSRMGQNKQFLPLAGIPVLARTLIRLQKNRAVSSIILVVRAEDLFAAQNLADRYGIGKLTDIVSGGKTRQESVMKGIERLPQTADKVLIHDGARPLVSEEIIEAVTAALEEYPAVTCAVALKDTVKQVDEKGMVKATPDRGTLRAVQTPQGVRVKEYREAAAKAGDLSAFTDDTSLMEAAGFAVKTVPGSYTNIKITTAEDMLIAESFLKGEEAI